MKNDILSSLNILDYEVVQFKNSKFAFKNKKTKNFLDIVGLGYPSIYHWGINNEYFKACLADSIEELQEKFKENSLKGQQKLREKEIVAEGWKEASSFKIVSNDNSADNTQFIPKGIGKQAEIHKKNNETVKQIFEPQCCGCCIHFNSDKSMCQEKIKIEIDVLPDWGTGCSYFTKNNNKNTSESDDLNDDISKTQKTQRGAEKKKRRTIKQILIWILNKLFGGNFWYLDDYDKEIN